MMTKEDKLNDPGLLKLELGVTDLLYYIWRQERNAENEPAKFRELLFVTGLLVREFEKRLDEFLYGGEENTTLKKTDLEGAQEAMRERQKPRRGKKAKATEVPDTAMLKLRRRVAAYVLLQKGTAYGLVADAINKEFGTALSADSVKGWHQAGCPLL